MSSVQELTAELKSLKKRLYTFQFKGLELQEKARGHLMSHRLAELNGHSDPEEYEENSDLKSQAFGTTTPLANEYILEMVSSYLPIQDIRNCQQVCKLWSKEMRRCALKRKSLVVAYEDDCEDAEEILKEKKQGNSVNISTLVVLEIPLESRIVQDILINFGSTMSGLKLDEGFVTAQEIYSALQHIPCLETFAVKTTSRRLRQGEMSLLDQITSDSFMPKIQLKFLKKLVWEDAVPVNALERLPQMCPKLVFLKLHTIGLTDPEKFRGLKWDSLQVLNISAEVEFKTYHFEALSLLGLKLIKLSLQNVKPGGRSKMKKLNEFLNTLQDTLVEISLVESPIPYENESDKPYIYKNSPFPIQMSRLKYIKTDFGFIKSLSMADDLPALVRLDCKCKFWRNWWTILCKSELPRLHPIVNECNLGAIDEECLQKVALAFPNLMRLEVAEDRIGDWALQTMCRSMTKLRSLRITKALGDRKCLKITDSGLIGIPETECIKMLRDKDFSTQRADKFRKYPYIGNLKELRILEIESLSDFSLTDLSVFCGFSKLSNLVILSLPRCKISEAGWSSLANLPNPIISKEAGGGRRILRSSSNNESFSKLRNISYCELLSELD